MQRKMRRNMHLVSSLAPQSLSVLLLHPTLLVFIIAAPPLVRVMTDARRGGRSPERGGRGGRQARVVGGVVARGGRHACQCRSNEVFRRNLTANALNLCFRHSCVGQRVVVYNVRVGASLLDQRAYGDFLLSCEIDAAP